MSDECLIAKIVYLSLKSKEVTQQAIAQELNVSQQSISRKLKELEEKDLIRRSLSKEGEIIRVTENGEKILEDCLSMMRTTIISSHILEIKGGLHLDWEKVEFSFRYLITWSPSRNFWDLNLSQER